jgi:hypothetical protein
MSSDTTDSRNYIDFMNFHRIFGLFQENFIEISLNFKYGCQFPKWRRTFGRRSSRIGTSFTKFSPIYLENFSHFPTIFYEFSLKFQSVSVPKDSITCVKRFLGKNLSEISSEITDYPFKLKDSHNGNLEIEVTHNGQNFPLTAEEISAIFLTRLQKMAILKSSQNDVREVVFAVNFGEISVKFQVPGSWNDRQKIALVNSAEISGLKPTEIISSNTAGKLSGKSLRIF